MICFLLFCTVEAVKKVPNGIVFVYILFQEYLVLRVYFILKFYLYALEK